MKKSFKSLFFISLLLICNLRSYCWGFYAHQKINYYATLFGGNKLLVSQEYFSDKILDKVGSGDCFMAGLIYGYFHELPEQDILEFATAAAFEKLFVKGDSTNKTVAEINAVIKKKND